MSEALIALPLAKEALAVLRKRLVDLRASRQQELEEIRNVFGNPELLAQSYL